MTTFDDFNAAYQHLGNKLEAANLAILQWRSNPCDRTLRLATEAAFETALQAADRYDETATSYTAGSETTRA